MSDSLWPHELQHAMPPFPSLSPGVCSNSCPLSRWCHPTISSSVIPFSSCPQPLPASGSFPMTWLFASGSFDTLHQIIEESASASALPMNIQGWFPLGLIGEGNGNPLWYSCLENPTDKGAFWATVHGVTESDMTERHNTCTYLLPKEFYPTPQFKGISSVGFSLHYGPALPSVLDSWKNHSFDYMEFYQKTDVFAF